VFNWNHNHQSTLRYHYLLIIHKVAIVIGLNTSVPERHGHSTFVHFPIDALQRNCCIKFYYLRTEWDRLNNFEDCICFQSKPIYYVLLVYVNSKIYNTASKRSVQLSNLRLKPSLGQYWRFSWKSMDFETLYLMHFWTNFQAVNLSELVQMSSLWNF